MKVIIIIVNNASCNGFNFFVIGKCAVSIATYKGYNFYFTIGFYYFGAAENNLLITTFHTKGFVRERGLFFILRKILVNILHKKTTRLEWFFVVVDIYYFRYISIRPNVILNNKTIIRKFIP